MLVFLNSFLNPVFKPNDALFLLLEGQIFCCLNICRSFHKLCLAFIENMKNCLLQIIAQITYRTIFYFIFRVFVGNIPMMIFYWKCRNVVSSVGKYFSSLGLCVASLFPTCFRFFFRHFNLIECKKHFMTFFFSFIVLISVFPELVGNVCQLFVFLCLKE